MSLETEIKKFADAIIGLTAAIEANTKAAQEYLAFNQQHIPGIVAKQNEVTKQELIDQASQTPFVVLDASTNQVISEPVAEQPAAEEAKQKVKEKPAAGPTDEPRGVPTTLQEANDPVLPITLAELQKLGKKLIDAGRTKELTDSVKALGHPAMSKMPVELYPQMLAKLQELIGGAE